MGQSVKPRQILQELLRGNAASRPLFLPIAFGLAARVENLSLSDFLANPTKISNAVRQTHARLRSDGVSCYFDPFIEVEALGGRLGWESGPRSASAHPPNVGEPGQLPAELTSPEAVIKNGRVPIALEVIRRLKTLFRDEILLMAGVSGPFALASHLIGWNEANAPQGQEISEDALQFSAGTITAISKAFAEAGASLIFVRENTLLLRAEIVESWAATLASLFNIVRFYETLPILQIANAGALVEATDALARLTETCVLCTTPEALEKLLAIQGPLARGKFGISLPTEALLRDRPDDAAFGHRLVRLISELRAAIVTTADDLPPTTDLKRLAAVSEAISRR